MSEVVRPDQSHFVQVRGGSTVEGQARVTVERVVGQTIRAMFVPYNAPKRAILLSGAAVRGRTLSIPPPWGPRKKKKKSAEKSRPVLSLVVSAALNVLRGDSTTASRCSESATCHAGLLCAGEST
jgi:hypothetical protein